MVQGAGCGLIAGSLLLGFAGAMDEGGIGGLCLLLLILVLMALIGSVFFLITFSTATIIGLRGKGKPVWLRLVGLLPILAVLVGTIGWQAIAEKTQLGDEDDSVGLFFAGLWLGVCLIFFNAALVIPRKHPSVRQLCMAMSWLPLLVMVTVGLGLPTDQTLWAMLIAPPLIAGLSALVIFSSMGQLLHQYPVDELIPGQAIWYYPK